MYIQINPEMVNGIQCSNMAKKKNWIEWIEKGLTSHQTHYRSYWIDIHAPSSQQNIKSTQPMDPL